MFDIVAYTIAAEERLSTMEQLIRDFGHENMPQELEEWQRADMRRHYTNIDTPNYVSAETTIWPRSRTYEKAHRAQPLPRRLLRRPSSMPRLKGVPGAKRPILRPELFGKLCARMADLMGRKLTWRLTSRP